MSPPEPPTVGDKPITLKRIEDYLRSWRGQPLSRVPFSAVALDWLMRVIEDQGIPVEAICPRDPSGAPWVVEPRERGAAGTDADEWPDGVRHRMKQRGGTGDPAVDANTLYSECSGSFASVVEDPPETLYDNPRGEPAYEPPPPLKSGAEMADDEGGGEDEDRAAIEELFNE